MIPRLLAQVIHQNPQLTAPGVQSFYTRTTQFKKLREFKYFAPNDWVTVNVQFSRPLFAMIKSQKFTPPPAFPARALSASEREMYSLGIKLTCAFELLASSDSRWTKRVLDVWNTEKERVVEDAELKEWAEKCEEEQVRAMIANFERFMEGESGFEGIDDEFAEFDSDDDIDDDDVDELD